MKIEDQVCSLDSAKRLKDLGFEQESLFWWNRHVSSRDWSIDDVNKSKISHWESVSAYTVSELGELLKSDSCAIYWGGKSWGGKDDDFICSVKTEAEARALRLIYLIEQGLIIGEDQ